MSTKIYHIPEKEYIDKIDRLEEEVKYLKEQLQSQRIMLSDAMEYIQILEQKIEKADKD